MRRALSFVTQFIGSGHVDTEKIIGVEKRDPGSYFIPLHEFLRSLLHGDNEHYDPHTSPIANLFAIDRPDERGHFLLPLALDYVLARGDAKDSSGYVELHETYRHLQGYGYSIDAIAFALNSLARFRLIEAPLSDFDVAHADRARVTTVGAYTLRNLPGLFTYCDAVSVDTPILDSQARSDVRHSFGIVERLTRAETFRRYLDECWGKVGLSETGWSWPPVSRSLQEDIDRVRARAVN